MGLGVKVSTKDLPGSWHKASFLVQPVRDAGYCHALELSDSWPEMVVWSGLLGIRTYQPSGKRNSNKA